MGYSRDFWSIIQPVASTGEQVTEEDIIKLIQEGTPPEDAFEKVVSDMANEVRAT